MDLNKIAWRKASRSKEDGSNCVELAMLSGFVAIRDSKNPDGPKLIISQSEFSKFSGTLKGF